MTPGEKWVRLIRSYGPVADNEAMQAEHVEKLAEHYGIPHIKFAHPARQAVLDCFPPDGNFLNTVLTGTAGEGKTSLSFELVHHLTGHTPDAGGGVEVITVSTLGGTRTVTLIYDVTAWRKKTAGYLSPEHVEVLHRMARSVYQPSDEFFVLAVNDGQMHALFRSLPPDAPEIIRVFQRDLIHLHTNGEEKRNRLRLVNLSRVPSETLMRLSLTALLDRPEWRCFQEEKENPLFAGNSSLTRNFQCLSSAAVRERLITLARIADVSGHHLPVRGLLCLLSNALLGHPDAKDKVLRQGTEAATLLASNTASKAALHRTLFGDNLSANTRRKREVYRFLSMLHAGEETTNDLDELIIFGSRMEELSPDHEALVVPDPHHQRNPSFPLLVGSYIRGDLTADETDVFLHELTTERRRLFLSAPLVQLHSFRLWRTTVFHHAGDFLEHVLNPLQNQQRVKRQHLRLLAAGLNRVWTGLFLADTASEVYLTTGLDLTTSPVSDIALAQIEINSEPPGLDICSNAHLPTPDMILRHMDKEFKFPLTLPRFEFLCRVADGAMPSSFSREAFADFMALKQRCLRDLDIRANSHFLNLIDVTRDGTIHKRPVHLES